MFYTRENIIKKLKKSTGFFEKDIKKLLFALDDLVEDLLAEATDDEDVTVQLIRGLKISNKILEERDRVDPRNFEPIVCPPRSKVSVKISATMRDVLNNKYNETKEN